MESASQLTSASKTPSSLARASARKAALLAKAKYLDQSHQLEFDELRIHAEQLRIKTEKERIELQAEIDAAEAEENVLQRYEDRDKAVLKDVWLTTEHDDHDETETFQQTARYVDNLDIQVNPVESSLANMNFTDYASAATVDSNVGHALVDSTAYTANPLPTGVDSTDYNTATVPDSNVVPASIESTYSKAVHSATNSKDSSVVPSAVQGNVAPPYYVQSPLSRTVSVPPYLSVQSHVAQSFTPTLRAGNLNVTLSQNVITSSQVHSHSAHQSTPRIRFANTTHMSNPNLQQAFAGVSHASMHHTTTQIPAVSTQQVNFTATHTNHADQSVFSANELGESSFVQTMQNIAHLTESASLPKPELLSFDGNAKNYYKFIRNFETNIENKVSDANTKLSYLIQFCSGEPKQLIEDCVLLEPQQGYAQAKLLLRKRYGQPHIIARAYIDSLSSGPRLGNNDVQGLVKLSTELNKCQLTLLELGYTSDINSTHTIRSIVKRLPNYVRSKWVERADSIIETGLEPNFGHLVRFVETRARAASNLYGLELASDNKQINRQGANAKPQSKSKVTTLSTNVNSSETNNRSAKTQTFSSESCICICCKKVHGLNSCDVFKQKSLDDRREFIRQHKLCFNCLQQSHIAKKCTEDPQCSKCKGKHNELVHDGNRFQRSKQNDPIVTSASSHNVSVGKHQVSLRILPVCVQANNKSVKTYALLDPGSNATLCNESLVKELGLQSETFTLNMNTVTGQTESISSEVSFVVSDLENKEQIQLERVYSVPNLSVSLNNLPDCDLAKTWPHLLGIELPRIRAEQVSLLIGSDVPEVFWVIDERRGCRKEPYAIKSLLGWSVIGPTSVSSCDVAGCQVSVNFQCATLEKQIEIMWKTDFSDSISDSKVHMSVEDRRALEIMDKTVKMVDGKYQLSLPWRNPPETLPNNRSVAVKRLGYLKRKLLANKELYDGYKKTVNEYLVKGHALKFNIQHLEASLSAWYLPHHPVVNPNKPGKVRVVFDCSAKYQGVSLNDNLLQGPDLVNNLIGVLVRFRQDRVAVVGDIEAMFHQVKVQPRDRNFLRFLWWPNGNLDATPEEYCMDVHLFGASSSPSCSSFCLKRAAEDNKGEFSAVVVDTVHKNFYVDDCLKSVDSSANAISLVKDMCALLKKGGFRLTKWVSNDRDVLASIPEEEKAPSVSSCDLSDKLPYERALGLQWNVELDSFSFKLNLKDKPATRRGILSVASSLYDPLGFVSPVTLIPKIMLQSFCRQGLQWDDPITDDEEQNWKDWVQSLDSLKDVAIDRCIKPEGLSSSFTVELHHFADASEIAYGAVSYLKIFDVNGVSKCSFMMGKSRLAPIKVVSIPRLELSAAVVAVRLHQQLVRELDIVIHRSYFWTDSMSTLLYIRNESKRFKTFIANRLSVIHDVTSPADWNYIPSEINPADVASRGILPGDTNRLNHWLHGPKFLYGLESYPTQPVSFGTVKVELEEKQINSVVIAVSPFSEILLRFSDWFQMQKAVAWLLRFKQFCVAKYFGKLNSVMKSALTVNEVRNSRIEILKIVQNSCFSQEISCLQVGRSIPKSSSLYKLCPFLEDGLLKVGGRLEKAPLFREQKHPIILPSRHHVTELIVRFYHEISGHVGLHHVLSMTRKWFWIVRGLSTVKRIVGNCFSCKRRFTQPSEQQMGNLPVERVTPDRPPFTFIGIDYFGPLTVKVRRSQEKRYGCLFTCLASRAVHIEVAHSLDTDSFLGAFMRFVARRGKPEVVFSDNGTNFVSGERELREALGQLNQFHVNDRLLQHDIAWHFNPPLASHMGGVWERLVKSTKRILKALIGQQLITDEQLVTFVVEAEKVINDRPIIPVSSDSTDLEALTPSQILLLRSNSSIPYGIFTRDDSYSKRWWRQVQYLSNVFWKRWVHEYLPTLQQRQKWCDVKRNLSTGDIVLLCDENSQRGKWPLARVVNIIEGRDKCVRSVQLRVGNTMKVRPITKVCLLEQAV